MIPLTILGIITRDSIILVDFIHLSPARGRSLFDAIVESRVVRLRPMNHLDRMMENTRDATAGGDYDPAEGPLWTVISVAIAGGLSFRSPSATSSDDSPEACAS